MYQLADRTNTFDTLEFFLSAVKPPPGVASYLYTNLPYTLNGGGERPHVAASFLCRRRNWNVECHLLEATRPEGKSIYVGYGGGDLVPLRLDGGVTIDKRQPAHMVEFSHGVTDKPYESAQTFTFGNTPYVVSVSTLGGVVQYSSIAAVWTAAGSDGAPLDPLGLTSPLSFPPDVYVVGEASTTLTAVGDIAVGGPDTTDTGAFVNQDAQGNVNAQPFQVIPYNSLVYLIRAVANVAALGEVGGRRCRIRAPDRHLRADSRTATSASRRAPATSGAACSTSAPPTRRRRWSTRSTSSTSRASRARRSTRRRSSSRSLSSTARPGSSPHLSNFLGQQFWTFVYPEIVAQPGETVNGVAYPDGLNIDADGKPILSLQKLHFVYDPIAVLFTPNDLTHKYPLQPKQQVLALTNGQVREGICWRTAQPPARPASLPRTSVRPADPARRSGHGSPEHHLLLAQPAGGDVTRAPTTWACRSTASSRSRGPSTSIEESAMQSDQTGSGFISQVSSTSNMLIGVLFDYDNNDLGTLSPYDPTQSTKGVVFLNGYLSASGYASPAPTTSMSNDVLPSQVPLLEEIADILGLRRRLLRHRRQPAPAVLEPHLRRLHGPGTAELHRRRAACARRPDLHQPHPLAAPEPAEPGAPDAARADGHLQLRRLGQPAPGERRHRLDLPEQEGRPRHRLDREQPSRAGTSPALRAARPSTTSSSSPATTTRPCRDARSS